MEAFISQYPNSVVKIEATEQAMAAYQQAGNVAKVRETATRILQLDADNIRALAIVTFLKRAEATRVATRALQRRQECMAREG